VAIEGITRLDENEEFKSSGGEGRGGVEPAWRGKRVGLIEDDVFEPTSG
jgi:hypothetical protein